MNLRQLVSAASVAALVFLQPYRPFVVDGLSMNPTFASGQWVLGEIRPHRVARGDVVVFRHGDETMVKRVAYLAGDQIERYRYRGEWYAPLNETMRGAMVRQRLRRDDMTVPPGTLYVVGDNYRESVDSRTYGPIDASDVLAVLPNAAPCADPWSAPGHLSQSLAASL